jgi:hypothetical protein
MMFPNIDIDELWDPNLYMAPKIARIVSGEATPRPRTQPQTVAQSFNAMVRGVGNLQGPLMPQSFAPLTNREAAPRPRTQQQPLDSSTRGFGNEQKPLTQAKTLDDESGKDFEEIVRSLRKPASEKLQSPLLTLQQQVANVFQHGPLRIGGVFGSLSIAARAGVTKAEFPDGDLDVPWNSCKAAATLVGILARPAKRLFEVVKSLSQALNGLPSYEEIHNTPSASLLTAFQPAKALARGEKGISSALVVSLIDVHIFELVKQERSEDYTSFAHTFVLGIGPEGVIIWQGWGEHGYGLDQWIKNGDARVRSWKEADDFVDVFEKFVSYKVSRLHKSLS